MADDGTLRPMGAAGGARRSRLARLLGPVLPALLRQRRRLVLASVAIAIGVGYLAGALGLLGRIGSGLDDLATASADEADLVIEGEVAYESELEQVRRLVPASVAEAAAGMDGVASVSHRLEDVAWLVDVYGEPVVPLGLTEQPLAVNWPEDPSVAPFEFLEGGPPQTLGEVAVDARSAEKADVGIGDTITVAGKGPVAGYTVSGIVDAEQAGLPEGSSLAVLATEAARTVFDRPLDDNRVAVVLEEGADPAAVAGDLREILPSGVVVVDSATAALHQQEGLTRSFTLVRGLVSAFGVLALLVGMSTVANSLGLLHGERRKLYAEFRLVGATRRQLRRAAMVEALLLALVSSLVGIPLGVLFALLIERALGSLGTAVPTSGPVLSWQAAVWAVGLGVLATLVAAWRPVSRACDVAPVEAVSPEPENPAPSGWPRGTVAMARAVVIGVAAAGVGLLAGWEPLTVTQVGAAALIAVLLLGAVPRLLAGAVALVMAVLPFRPAPLRRIAARDARRSPRRTAFTAVALLLATAVVAGLAVFLASFTRSLDEQVDGLITADLVVDSGTFTRGGLPGDLLERLAEVEGVDSVSGWQLGRGTLSGQSVRLTGLDGASALSVVSPRWSGAAPEGLDERSAWLSRSMAERAGVQPGASVNVLFTSGGSEVLEVTGIYETGSTLLGDLVVERSVLLRQVPATVDLAALLRTDGSGATTEAVIDTAAAYGVTSVLSPSEFIDSRSELLRGFQRVILWMLVFTLVQAVIGLVNTLVMSVGERRREFGLLRVSGGSRAQVLRMVLFEAFAIAVVGTFAGLLVGVGGARLGVWAMAPMGLGTFAVPVGTLAAVAAAAVGVGLLAAAVPAAMAGRVPALEAVADAGELVTARRGRKAKPEVPEVPEVRVAHAQQPMPLSPATPLPLSPPPFSPTTLPVVHTFPAGSVCREVALGDVELTAVLLTLYEPDLETSDGLPPREVSLLDALAALLDAPGSPLRTVIEPTPNPPAPAVAPPPAPSVAPPPAPAAATWAPPVVPAPAPPPESAPAAPSQAFAPPPPPVFSPAPGAAATAFSGPTDLASSPAPAAPVPQPQPQPEPTPPPRAEPLPPPVAPPPVAPPPVAPPPVAPPPVAPPPVELPPVVAFPVEPREGAEPGPVPGQEVPAEAPTPASEGEAPEETRRERIRKRASVRFPRRKTRREAPTGSAAEGWVSDSGSSEAATGQATAAGAADVGQPGIDPAEAARVTDETFAAAVRSLDSNTVLSAAGALSRVGLVLAPGEWVGSVVCGTVREWPAAVVRTDRRLLVVVDRPGKPIVESLHPVATGVSIEADAAHGGLLVVLVDRGRRLEVHGVVELSAAEGLLRREELSGSVRP